MRKVIGVFRKIINAIKDAGNIATALLALFALGGIVVAFVLQSHSAPSVVEATFEEAKVEPDVLLEQYEYSSQTASVDYGSQALPGGYRLVADTAPASTAPAPARSAIGVLATVSESSTATSASSSTAASSSRSGGEEAESKEEEKAKKELQLQEAEELKEEAKQKERAQLDEEKVRREEARQREEAERGEAVGLKGGEQAKAEEAQAQAKAAKAREEATIRAKEQATVKKEAEHPALIEPARSSTPLYRDRDGDAKVLVGTGAPAGEVEAVLSKAGVNVSLDCRASCALTPTVDKAIADDPSNLDEAAKEVAATFNGSRVQVYDHKSQPVGVTVDYAIDFVGYAGKRMILEWTLCSEQTERPLPREWWRNVIVKQIEPTSNSTKIPGNFWAPIPPQRSDYYFRLKVFYDESEAAHGETDMFH
jgi:hypothetical protein